MCKGGQVTYFRAKISSGVRYETCAIEQLGAMLCILLEMIEK